MVHSYIITNNKSILQIYGNSHLKNVEINIFNNMGMSTFRLSMLNKKRYMLNNKFILHLVIKKLKPCFIIIFYVSYYKKIRLKQYF